MMRFFKKKKATPLSPEELAHEERERQESARNPMGDPSTDVFGDGSIVNNVSRAQLTVNENGLDSIVSRRVFEPRKGQSQSDQEAL
jgi:hypothetical protein